MPKDKLSGFREQTNEQRREEDRDRRYKTFDSSEYGASMDYFRNSVDKWLASISDEERNGVVTYTGGTYSDINEYLRSGKFGSGKNAYLESIIRDATNGIKKFKLENNVTVYRKSSASLFSELGIHLGYSSGSVEKFVNDLNKMKGSVVRDMGFTSSSIRSDKWTGSVHYEIKVPKGTNCAYVESISHYQSEKELLFNRGTRFRILGATVKNGVPYVRLLAVKK